MTIISRPAVRYGSSALAARLACSFAVAIMPCESAARPSGMDRSRQRRHRVREECATPRGRAQAAHNWCTRRQIAPLSFPAACLLELELASSFDERPPRKCRQRPAAVDTEQALHYDARELLPCHRVRKRREPRTPFHKEMKLPKKIFAAGIFLSFLAAELIAPRKPLITDRSSV